MKFTKMQGTGNDFILVEGSDAPRNLPRAAVDICHRRLGVGADGLLLLLPSEKADFRMRIFNPDGSEAEACGNGLRCLARYIFYKKLTKAKKIQIETMSGIRQVKYQGTAIQVSMGKPELRGREIPVALADNLLDITPIMDYALIVNGRNLSLNFVSMGNPHAVYFSSKPVKDFPLQDLGPTIEYHKIFPKRVNFEVARVINREEIEMRVWERGAGETQACGTGACAVAVTAQLHDYVGSKVNVKLPGGTLNIEWDKSGEVFLGGPAEVVFTGDWLERK